MAVTKFEKPMGTDLNGGQAGQLLRKRTNADLDVEWSDVGTPTDAQVGTAVSAWLTAHPEATTTVQDGAISRAKLDADLKEKTDEVPALKSAFDSITDKIVSVNVLDINKLVPGYYVNQGTGAYESNANHGVIKNCPITESTIVISTTVQAWNFAVRYFLYDENGDPITNSGSLLNQQSDWSNIDGRYYHKITGFSSNAKSISISASSYATFFSDSAKTQIADGDVIAYYPYGDTNYTKVKSDSSVTVEEEFARVEEEIARVEDLVIHGNSKTVQEYDDTNLASGGFVSLDEKSLLKEYTIVFNSILSSFSKITLGVCQNQSTLLNRIDVDSTTVTVKNFFCTVTSYDHGLTIENDLQIRIKVNYDLTANLTVISNGAKFEQTIQWVSTTTPMSPFVLSDGTVTTYCKLTMVSDWNRPIYAVGDSYFNYATDRWAYYLAQYDYIQNVLINASPGIGSNQAKTTLDTLIEHGCPKYIIWAIGMNDGSDSGSTPNTIWKNGVEYFINFCEQNEIIPILATIPTVPTINNEAKNTYVRNSGYRYIDFAKAVGADSDGNWYDGMLEINTPRIHPTVEGALCLFMQAISDFPEMMVSK